LNSYRTVFNIIFLELFDNIFSVNVISNADNTTTHELIESQVENPLIDTNHQDLHAFKQLPIPSVHHHRIHHRQKNQSFENHAGKLFLNVYMQ
jgi:hypothetical protein